MTTELKSTSQNIRRTPNVPVFVTAFGLLAIAASLLTFAVVRNANRATSASLSQPARLDAAQQGVMDYLKAHAAAAKSAPVDPAVQSVMSYLQLHAVPAARLDAANLGVMNYLKAHGVGQPEVIVLDPAQQGVMDYLEAHGK